jgi:hypothetical protein
MTPEERWRFNDLCNKVQIEQDPKKFDEYVRELNELLEAKERRFKEDAKKDPLL